VTRVDITLVVHSIKNSVKNSVKKNLRRIDVGDFSFGFGSVRKEKEERGGAKFG